MNDTQGPDPVDVYVGDRIRARRKAQGVSQEQLGRGLGVTFQQVQKYERGSNRISASMLVRAARALDVEVAYFFDGLDDLPSDAAASELQRERTRRTFAAAEAMPQLLLVPDLTSRQRRTVAQVIDLAVAANAPPSDEELNADHTAFRENAAAQHGRA